MKLTCYDHPILRSIRRGVMAFATLLAPVAIAGPYMPAPAPIIESDEPSWTVGVSFDYTYRFLNRTENYRSGPELWFVDYDDFDGDLWGFSLFVTPPCVGGATVDFTYRTGDLEGRFFNFSLDPNPIDPTRYTGRASFDRDEYELGLSVPFPGVPWLFGRVEGFRHEEEGDWDYGGGFFEAQEYELWGINAGLGASHTYPLGFAGASLSLNAFLGLVYFDFQHTELTTPVDTNWDGWGFKGSIDARFTVPVGDHVGVFVGTGYEYLLTDDGSLEMDTQGLLVSLGLQGQW